WIRVHSRFCFLVTPEFTGWYGGLVCRPPAQNNLGKMSSEIDLLFRLKLCDKKNWRSRARQAAIFLLQNGIDRLPRIKYLTDARRACRKKWAAVVSTCQGMA